MDVMKNVYMVKGTNNYAFEMYLDYTFTFDDVLMLCKSTEYINTTQRILLKRLNSNNVTPVEFRDFLLKHCPFTKNKDMINYAKRLYEREGLSLSKILDMINLKSLGQLHKVLLKHGTTMRNCGSKKPDKATLERLLFQYNYRPKHIAAKYGVVLQTAHNWLKSYGIDWRAIRE